MAQKITLGTDVLTQDRVGQSHESAVVICDDHDAALRALDRLCDRAMRVDETGVEHPADTAGEVEAYTPNYAAAAAVDSTGLGPSVYIDCKGEISKPMGKTFRRILTEELQAEPSLERVRVITADAASRRMRAKRRRALAKAFQKADPHEVARRALETSQNIAMVNTRFTSNPSLDEDVNELRQRGWHVECVEVAHPHFMHAVTVPQGPGIWNAEPEMGLSCRPAVIVFCGDATRLPWEERDRHAAGWFHEDANSILRWHRSGFLTYWVEPNEGRVEQRLVGNVRVINDLSIAGVAREFDLHARRPSDRKIGIELLTRASSVALIHDDNTLEDALAAEAELQRQACVAKLIPTSWFDDFREATLAYARHRATRDKLEWLASRETPEWRAYQSVEDVLIPRLTLATNRMYTLRASIAVVYALPESSDSFQAGMGMPEGGPASVWLQPGVEQPTLQPASKDHHGWRWVRGVDIREVARDIRLGHVP